MSQFIRNLRDALILIGEANSNAFIADQEVIKVYTKKTLAISQRDQKVAEPASASSTNMKRWMGKKAAALVEVCEHSNQCKLNCRNLSNSNSINSLSYNQKSNSDEKEEDDESY